MPTTRTTEPAPTLTARVWAVIALAWFAMALLGTATAYWSFRAQGADVPLVRGVFVVSLMGTLPWLLATPLILRFGRTVRPFGPAWRRAVPVHLLAGFVFVLIAAWLGDLGRVLYAGGPAPALLDPLRTPARASLLVFDVLLYWLILAAGEVWRAGHVLREQERAAAQLAVEIARLQTELAQAQLATLRSRLHPHFLFNALNGVQGLVRSGDGAAAAFMIGELGRLLRHSLAQDDRLEIPLVEEFDNARAFLAFEQLRTGPRMQWSIELPDSLQDTHVPALLLQPLVENAVRHGIGEIEGEGRVCVRAHAQSGTLVLEVENDGPRLDGLAHRDGIGLSLTRERLHRTYGVRARLELEAGPGGGAIARVTAPLRAASEPVHGSA